MCCGWSPNPPTSWCVALQGDLVDSGCMGAQIFKVGVSDNSEEGPWAHVSNGTIPYDPKGSRPHYIAEARPIH